MNPNFKTIIALALLSSGSIFVACHKDSTTNPATIGGSTNSQPTTMLGFFQKYGVQAQNFTINAGTGGSITGTLGTKFIFVPNSFRNSSNQTVTGNINIELKEVYSPTDMILSNMPTLSKTRPLMSGGEYYLNVTQGANTLKLAPGIKYTAVMKSSDSAFNMSVFNMGKDSAGRNVWVACNDSSYVYPDTTIYPYCVVQCDSLGWENCDAYYPGPYYTDSVSLSSCPNINNVYVFVYINGHHSMDPCYAYGSKFYCGWIPAGIPFTMVGVCVDNSNKLYSAFTTFTNPGGTQTVNLTFSSTTEAAFKTQLDALH
jgi:hypothetical protein